MGKGYSLDLRECVISFLKKGKGTQQNAAEQFGVGLRTISRRVERNKEGKLKADKQGSKNSKKVNRDIFKSYVNNNRGKTLKEIGAHFNISGAGAFNGSYILNNHKKAFS